MFYGSVVLAILHRCLLGCFRGWFDDRYLKKSMSKNILVIEKTKLIDANISFSGFEPMTIYNFISFDFLRHISSFIF
jgi:hypothetical protein